MNFGVVSIMVFGISRALINVVGLDRDLADGMVICVSLPMTVNMVIVMTKSSGGNEASALFNASFGSVLGVFITPALILLYLGQESNIDIGATILKLCYRIIIPLIVGQIIQFFVPKVSAFVAKYKSKFGKASESCLIYIVFCTFSNTFLKGVDASTKDILIMVGINFLCLIFIMTASWYLLACLYPRDPGLRIMAFYGIHHKTVAMGLPLLNAIFEGDPKLGVYCLPLLIWHPMQLLLGTFIAPKMKDWSDKEKERLASEEPKGEVELKEEGK